MKIYDCFTFFNEFDLLEIRLRELYDHVDYFVLIEADRTFQNDPKPFYYLENQERFAQWADKIKHLAITDLPQGDDPWAREEYQRNAILIPTKDADPEDMIIISDIDEIPRPETIHKVRNGTHDFYAFYMPLFQFRINFMKQAPVNHECWGQAVRRRFLNDLTPDFIRRNRFHAHTWPNATFIPHAGWHFSWWGATNESMILKLKSFSHSECNKPELLAKVDIDRTLREGTSWNPDEPDRTGPVQFNEYFPKAIREHQEQYSQYIISGNFPSVTDIIPLTWPN